MIDSSQQPWRIGIRHAVEKTLFSPNHESCAVGLTRFELFEVTGPDMTEVGTLALPGSRGVRAVIQLDLRDTVDGGDMGNYDSRSHELVLYSEGRA